MFGAASPHLGPKPRGATLTSGKDAPTALVIGATGALGGAVSERFLERGWRVHARHRNPQAARRIFCRPGLKWVKGDAMVEADVLGAAAGASLLVHGATPLDTRAGQVCSCRC